MSSLATAILKAMPPKGNLRRFRVGIFYNGNPQLVDSLVALGHRTVIFSNQFRPLYRMLRAFQKRDVRLFDTTAILETALDALPIAEKSLDVLIVSSGLSRRGGSPAEQLETLGRLIKPGGTMIWPERVSDGILGKFSRVRHPRSRFLGPIPRRALCRFSMAAGLRDIGQFVVVKKAEPWTVTFGKVGKRTYNYTA